MDFCDPLEPRYTERSIVILLIQFLAVDEACEIMKLIDITTGLFSSRCHSATVLPWSKSMTARSF